MPQIVTTPDAARDIERCLRFLGEKNPSAALRAAEVILTTLQLLETAPDIGRPYPERHGARELIIPFGASGYVALYLHDPSADLVYILAFRHLKEIGY